MIRAVFSHLLFIITAGNYMFKVNNKNTRTRCEICSKLTVTTPEKRTLNIQLLTYFTPCSSVSIINFKHVIAGWVIWHSAGGTV